MPSTFATFNGQNIFGAWVQMKTRSAPRAEQRNSFAGVTGVESLDHGGRGRLTVAVGRHVGATSSGMGGLATVQEAMRAYQNKNSYTLVDTRGVTWMYVKLIGFDPEGPIKYAGNGSYSQLYSAQFFHML